MWTDRRDAGRDLAAALDAYAGKDTVVLGIPRGGVVVAAEVASALKAPLDIVVPRKIGAPSNPELAVGAVAGGGIKWLDKDLIGRLGVSESYLQDEIDAQLKEIGRRERSYREGRPAIPLEGKTVILVDDGIATGATTRAAIEYVRRHTPKRLILAVPVAPPAVAQSLRPQVDLLVVLSTPEMFFAVGQFYDRFESTSDEEVIDILRMFRHSAV